MKDMYAPYSATRVSAAACAVASCKSTIAIELHPLQIGLEMQIKPINTYASMNARQNVYPVQMSVLPIDHSTIYLNREQPL